MKKHLIIIFVFVILSVAGFIYSCKHDPVGLENLKKICFNSEVLPIIQANCTMSGCHDGSLERGDFRTYEGIMDAVTPGNPNQSRLYNTMTDAGHIMPPSPNHPLSQEQRTLINVWIWQGAKNENCDSSKSSTINPPPTQGNDSVCFSQQILPILRSSCGMTNCHDNTSAAEEVILTSYQTLSQSGIPKVMKAINDGYMPPSPVAPLSADQIALFNKWNSQGAKNTTCISTICDSSNVSFSGTVSTIIKNNCQGCHSGSAPSFGISLVSYNDVKTVASNGLLVSVITQTNSKPLMPPGSAMGSCQINQIKKWVGAGAPNN